jgi:hypothetical protein
MAANTDEAERQIGRLQREASGYKSVQTKERLQATRAYKQKRGYNGRLQERTNKRGYNGGLQERTTKRVYAPRQ